MTPHENGVLVKRQFDQNETAHYIAYALPSEANTGTKKHTVGYVCGGPD